MSLISFSFLLFCIITILIYFIVPKKFQWIILLISSICFLFYKNLNIYTIIQSLIVLLSSYSFGILIEKFRNEKKSKIFLLIGIFIILAQLIYLKYTNVFLRSFNLIFSLFNIKYRFILLSNKPVLIGISYYSLIMISYLIDIYRRACESQKNIFKCALFMSYFPILTSGPFIRYDNIKDKLYSQHKFNYSLMCKGLIRILWGLFKVIVISQRLGYFVDTVYGNIYTYIGFYIVIATLFFTLQLYTNFSGSIDIIMGISEIFGIDLPENFRAPFFSKTITEFWRNWHITLGAWLKDYIFYPLLKSNFIQALTHKCKNKFGKKIGKKIPLYICLFIMWILIGIWHGGDYTFIIGSGILQFVFILIEDIFGTIIIKINDKLGINMKTFSYKLYQVIRTYLLFSFAMIFFRADSVINALETIRFMFVWNPWILFDHTSLYAAGLDRYDFGVLIISLVALFIVDIGIKKFDSVRDKLLQQNIVFRWGVIYLLLFVIIIFGCYGVDYNPSSFIYRQF